jgi:hypothetical protein
LEKPGAAGFFHMKRKKFHQTPFNGKYISYYYPNSPVTNLRKLIMQILHMCTWAMPSLGLLYTTPDCIRDKMLKITVV